MIKLIGVYKEAKHAAFVKKHWEPYVDNFQTTWSTAPHPRPKHATFNVITAHSYTDVDGKVGGHPDLIEFTYDNGGLDRNTNVKTPKDAHGEELAAAFVSHYPAPKSK